MGNSGTDGRTILEGWLMKAQGEGTRGGQVIGHTPSGRPIYATTHEHAKVGQKFTDALRSGGDYQKHAKTLGEHARQHVASEGKDFSAADHEHAARLHRQQERKHGIGPDAALAYAHGSIAKVHEDRAKFKDIPSAAEFRAKHGKLSSKEHESRSLTHEEAKESARGKDPEAFKYHHAMMMHHDFASQGGTYNPRDVKKGQTMNDGRTILEDYLEKAELRPPEGQKLDQSQPPNGGKLEGEGKTKDENDSDEGEKVGAPGTPVKDLTADGQNLAAGAPAQGDPSFGKSMLFQGDPGYSAHVSHQLGQYEQGQLALAKARAMELDVDPLEFCKALPGKMGTDEGANRTPPKEYRQEGATSAGDYADPRNYKYPLHTEDNVRAAISYFSNPKNAGVYSESEQRSIWGRIKSAARRYKIELSDESGPPSVEKSLYAEREFTPIVMGERSDLEASGLLKSNRFYADSGPIRALEPATIDRHTACGCGEIYKSMYTACPACGSGRVEHQLDAAPDLRKSLPVDPMDVDQDVDPCA